MNNNHHLNLSEPQALSPVARTISASIAESQFKEFFTHEQITFTLYNLIILTLLLLWTAHLGPGSQRPGIAAGFCPGRGASQSLGGKY